MTSTNTPPARYSSASCRVSNDSILYPAGNLGGGMGPATNEFWRYTPSTRAWIKHTSCPCSGNSNPSGYDSTGNELFVYSSSSGTTATMYAYALALNTWRTVTQSATKPPVRLFSSAALNQRTRQFMVFAGWSSSTSAYFNDVWSFSIATSTWTQLSPTGGAGIVPFVRMSPCAVVTSRDELVIFGGIGDFAYLGDTWVFNAGTKWRQIGTLTGPAVRAYPECTISAQDEMYSFGGNNPGLFNDLWKIPIYTAPLSSSAIPDPAPSSTSISRPISSSSSSVVSLSSLVVSSSRIAASSSVQSSLPAPVSTPPSSLITGVTSISAVSSVPSSRPPAVSSRTSALNVAQSSSALPNQSSPSITEGAAEEIIIEEIVIPFSPNPSSLRTFSFSKIIQQAQTSVFGFINLPYIILAACIVIILLLVSFIFFDRSRRNMKKTTSESRKPTLGESRSSQDESSSGHSMTKMSHTAMSRTAMSTRMSNSTTIMTTDFGLSIPGYLKVDYGPSVRPKKEIAKGGFGKILLGEALDMKRVKSGTMVIIKELFSNGGQLSKRQMDSFYQEVAIMSFLSKHQNIATIYAYSESPFTIIMKYYPAGSLQNWIQSDITKISRAQKFYFALDIAQGVNHLHKNGLCHADLKPPNILIDIDTAQSLAFCVLTDFGITQVFSDKALLVKAFQPVTLNAASISYAAPEAILRLRLHEHVPIQVLPKLDIFSYAIVLFELVCRENAAANYGQ